MQDEFKTNPELLGDKDRESKYVTHQKVTLMVTLLPLALIPPPPSILLVCIFENEVTGYLVVIIFWMQLETAWETVEETVEETSSAC